MATITLPEGDGLRDTYRASVPLVYTKPVMRVAFQAAEDWLVANQSSFSSAINAATQPLGVTLTAAEKKALFAAYALWKYGKDK